MNKEAYDLFHEGALALADIEQNGIRVDMEYCLDQQKILNKKISSIENNLFESKEVTVWRNIYKDKFSLDSNIQLSRILFKEMKITPSSVTAKGNASVNKDSLEQIESPIIKPLIQLRKLKKLNNTYLKNIIEETVDGYVHPFFNLHTVRTFRSSSDRPNFQNMPIRDKEMGEVIRKAFIPRDGHLIGGIDYSAIEVRIAACYHKDPVMLEYIKDPSKDMHRDMAMECYLLEQDQVSKDIRYCAKNQFVFPQFYGSWYEDCTKALWSSISTMKLKRTDDIPLKEHLKSKGIKNPYMFMEHIKKVEDNFWNVRFKVYRDWKRRWVRDYQRKGYFDMLTGFRCKGVMKKNDIINYPIQGVAFHCLLWGLIRLNKWLKKNKMRSKIIGQIHDEITLDVHKEEMEEVLQQAKKIMCEDIREKWKWLIVPLEIEAEFSDKNWYEKKEVKI